MTGMGDPKKIFLSEEEKLQLRLSRSYTERFLLLMKLIKLDRKLKKAKIIEVKK
jgi:hypothetical protein